MAKKQTRRTISLERQFYTALVAHAKSKGMSASEYATRCAHADMTANGAEVPPLGTFASVRASVEIRPRTRPAPDGPAFRPQPQADADAKYRAALEFQRQQLVSKAPKPHVVNDSNRCGWCGDKLRIGEIPSEYGGLKVHGRCKREMIRTGAR